MDAITLKHNIMMAMLDEVSQLLEDLSVDSFIIGYPEVVKTMREVHEFKARMVQEHGIEKLRIYEAEALIKAGRVEEKYRKVVERFSTEEKRLERELAALSAKKKISNYLKF